MSHPLAELILDSPGLWPAALLAAAAVVLTVWRLYVPQVKRLVQPWRWLLPGLRCLGLLALAVCLLRPVVIRPASDAESGPILILLDNSRSMSARDLAYLPHLGGSSPQANLGISHLIALAEGLGLLAPGARDPALVAFGNDLARLQDLQINMARAQSELDFAGVSGQGIGAARLRVTRAQQQCQFAALEVAQRAAEFPKPARVAEMVTALTRPLNSPGRGPTQELVRLIHWADEALIAADVALYHSDGEIRAICDNLAAASRFSRVEMALTAPGAGLLSKFPEDVPLFGYTIGQDVEPLPLRGGDQPVRRLLEEPTGLQSDLADGVTTALSRFAGQPQAVILISDGRQVGGDSTLGQTGTPIFCVYAAGSADLKMPDVSVADLALPGSAFVGETLTARVRLRSWNMQGSTTTVSLAVDGAPPATRPATFSNETETLEFPVKFDAAGVHRLTASIAAPPDTPSDENKRLERWIKVTADPISVGLYCGAPGWDFQYVADALGRTPWITLHKGIFASDGERLDLTPRQISDLNLLVLFDVPYAALSESQWDAVDKWVSDQGGRVVIVADDQQIAQEYALHTPASLLLPYSARQIPLERDWPGKEAGFHARPANVAQAPDFLKLTDNPGAWQEDWAQLPGFYRYLSLPELKPAARPLLMEQDSSAPLLVENRVGLGETFFMAMNQTWRWRGKPGQNDQDRFWLQFVRYAAQQPYAARGEKVWLDADVISAAPGQPIHIRARVADDSQSSTQTAELYKDGRVAAKVVLAGSANGAGPYRGTLGDLAAGDYELRLSPSGGGAAAVLPLHVAANAEEEMADLSGNEQTLRRFAQASGGALLTLDRIGALPELIHRSQVAENRFTQQPLWDSYYLYALVVACFAAEWAIRKRVGLV